MAGPESEHIYGVQLRESADDGSDFSNADTDYRVLYLGEDGALHLKDSAGTVSDVAGAVLTGDRKTQAGPYTTSSGSVVDIDGTNLSITITTGARRVLIGMNVVYKISATSGNAYLQFKTDGTYGGDIIYGMVDDTTRNYPMTLTYLTDVLSAGSHTFKAGFAVDGSLTLTLNNVVFWVAEQLITA